MKSLELCRKYKEEEYTNRVSSIVKLDCLEGIHGESVVVSLTSELRELLRRVSVGLLDVEFDVVCNAVLLDAVSSASIEGCSVTVESIKGCMKGDSFSRDELMVLNIIKALSIYSGRRVWSIEDIVGMWKVVSSGVCENLSIQGSLFRNDMVYIGSDTRIVHTPELPKNIPSRMDSLVGFLNSGSVGLILKGIVCHYYIEYIRPMCYCNGRLGRLLQSLVIGGNVHKVSVNSVVNKNLPGYYRAIKNSNVPCKVEGLGICIDVAPFVEYILLCMLEAIGQ